MIVFIIFVFILKFDSLIGMINAKPITKGLFINKRNVKYMTHPKHSKNQYYEMSAIVI